MTTHRSTHRTSFARHSPTERPAARRPALAAGAARTRAARAYFNAPPAIQRKPLPGVDMEDEEERKKRRFEVTTYGKENKAAPGGYVDVTTDEHGRTVGLGGGLSMSDGEGGLVFGGRGHAGVLNGEEEGKRRVGLKLNGGVASGVDAGGGEFNFMSGDLELSGGEDGFTAGAGLTAMGWAVRDDQANPEETDELLTRVGLSGGVGFGVRGHWADSDGDGLREYGAGMDLGLVTLDLKSEWLAKKLAEMGE